MLQASGADVAVAVAFTDGTQTLEFVATANSDGTMTGDVTMAPDTQSMKSSAGDHDSEHDSDHDKKHHDSEHHDGDRSKKDHDGGDDDD